MGTGSQMRPPSATSSAMKSCRGTGSAFFRLGCACRLPMHGAAAAAVCGLGEDADPCAARRRHASQEVGAE
jgi:hypothetical protein